MIPPQVETIGIYDETNITRKRGRFNVDVFFDVDAFRLSCTTLVYKPYYMPIGSSPKAVAYVRLKFSRQVLLYFTRIMKLLIAS